MSDKKENYQLFVTIRTDKFQIEKVLCKVHLPKKLFDHIELYFHPTEDQVPKLRNVFRFSIYGEIKNFSGSIQTSIQSEKVYSINLHETHWGPNVIENVLSGEPTDLRITHFLCRDVSPSTPKTAGKFWLTPSAFLRPAQIITRSWSGDVQVETVRQFDFPLPNGVQLIFDNRYRYSKSIEGDSITFTELIAGFEFGNASKIEGIQNDILPFLDDFLMLVSFAERHRCICVGWDITDADCITEYYRRDLKIPQVETGGDHADTLIDLQYFKDFITKAYEKFTAIIPKEHLRQALQYAIYRKGRTVENSFLTLYGALETLVEHFGLSSNIVDPEQFEKVFVRDLAKWIKGHPLFSGNHNKNKRRLIYEKLPELNRVSFKTAFEELCKSYYLYLDDLWPVVGKSEGLSLSEIRNKLVHGETFNVLQQKALITAVEHLRWVVERTILSVLGWDISKSNVSSEFLYSQNISFYEKWKADQLNFSKGK